MKKIRIDSSRIAGKGVFADEDIQKGERIQYITGTKVRSNPITADDRERMATWYGVGRYTWIDPGDTPFRFLNHSCEPNAAVAGKKTLVAIAPIEKGDEITIDYSMTDADPHWVLDCQCGTPSCRKRIQAIYTVPQEVFLKHMPYIPRYFQRTYIRNHTRAKLKTANRKKVSDE